MKDLKRLQFCHVNLEDAFFDSLRSDYPGFDAWFRRKALIKEEAYVFYNMDGGVDGFLYLKPEDGSVADTTPVLPPAKRLKIGTFKVNPHGTRFGERLIKKTFDHAVALGVDEIYVTVFPKHIALVELLSKYGFVKVGEKKSSSSSSEDVMVRSCRAVLGDVVLDYPRFDVSIGRKYILAIYPEWHTRLLPDSKLNNEPPDIVKDISHSNSIHKVYLTGMRGTESLERGDILVVYRTSDGKGAAHFRSVITSICVVEEVRNIFSFANFNALLEFCAPYSVFTEKELAKFWRERRYPTLIRFTYNAALKKRLTRGDLIDRNIIDPDVYAGFMPLNDHQLNIIFRLGGIDEGLVINPS